MRNKVLIFFSALATTFVLSGALVAHAITKSPISIQVRLSRTSVLAGVPIHGVAIISNASDKTILVNSCATDGWLFVGLANKSVSFDPAVATVACASSIHLKPGANRFSIVVSTRYGECGSTTTPKCTGPVMPLLPKGLYHTSVVTLGLPKGTSAPTRLSVTIS
jgi:hypothetical protein